jgi:hypothetical protein
MGLQRAGHRVTLVGDAAELQRALAARRYDVVIAGIDDADALAPAIAANQATRLIPVVPRTARHDPRLRAQYAAFLLDRASLGQYLRAINASVTRWPARCRPMYRSRRAMRSSPGARTRTSAGFGAR